MLDGIRRIIYHIMNIHKKQAYQLQKLIANLQRHPVTVQTLLSCQFCGATSQEMAEQYTQKPYRPVYAALKWLTSPPGGFLPLLTSIPVRLAGRVGRPPRGYLLTEWGAQVLALLDPELMVSPPNPRDLLDLHHRFCELEVLVSAQRLGLQAQLEKALSYGKRKNVRADVYLTMDEQDVILEVEQELSRNNAVRAVKKFERWQNYVRAKGGRRHNLAMYLVFNLPAQDLQSTLQRWQKARTQAEQRQRDLFFPVYWLPISHFFGVSLSEALEQAVPLDALEIEVQTPQPATQPHGPETQVPPAWMHALYDDYMELVATLKSAAHPRERLFSFIELAQFIHQASFYPESTTMLYAANPRESLWLLRHYLHLPANQALFSELKTAYRWIQKRSGGMGLIMFRDAMTRLIWDIFLRKHGFSRGGALRATFQIPDFQDNRSDYWVDVRLTGGIHREISSFRIRDKTEAVGWILSGLFIYPEELGLGTPIWKYQPRRKKK